MASPNANDVLYTLKCGFFNGIYTGEGTPDVFSYDRLYDSDDMNMPYKRIVTEGIFGVLDPQPDGTDDTIAGDDFKVTLGSSSLQVVVAAGNGILGGRWFELETDQIVNINTNSAISNRIDSIIIQFNKTDRTVYLVYREGQSPTNPPALETTSDGTILELRIANLTVTPNYASESTVSIADRRAYDECPLITGLLQQISLGDRLNKFDEDVAEKLASYDSQFQNKLTQYDAAMQNIYDEWATLKQEIINTGGGGGGGTVEMATQHIGDYTTGTTVTVTDYECTTDTVFLFINGFYANTTDDYTLSDEGVVTFKNTINTGAKIDIVKFRIIKGASPAAGFSLSIIGPDGIELEPASASSNLYTLQPNTTYTAKTPNYGTAYAYAWQGQATSGGAWETISGATDSIQFQSGAYVAIRCTVTAADDENWQSIATNLEVMQTVATPTISFT